MNGIEEQEAEALAALWAAGGSIPAKVAEGLLERLGLPEVWEKWQIGPVPVGLLIDADIVVLQPRLVDAARQAARERDEAWLTGCHWAVVETVEAVGSSLEGGDMLGALLVGSRAARRLMERGSPAAEEPFVTWTIGSAAHLIQSGQHESAREVLVAAGDGARHVLGDDSSASARLDWEVAQLDAEEALTTPKGAVRDAALIVALEAAEDAAGRLEKFSSIREEPVLAWACLADLSLEANDRIRAARCTERAQVYHLGNWTSSGEIALGRLLGGAIGNLREEH